MGTRAYDTPIRRRTVDIISDQDPKNDEVQTRPLRWHPKLTPYRALTLFVGLGLCILKALLVSKEIESASIAVEWVLGTMVFLMFYILDLYEDHNKKNNEPLPWFFEYDCMDLVWQVLRSLNIDRPRYLTKEGGQGAILVEGAPTIVTNYRLLVSAAVLTFGMVKATLTYKGLSYKAATLDWVFGTVVTTIIYIVGLYEGNPFKKNHPLFDRDDSPTFILITREGSVLLLALLSFYIPFFAIPQCRKGYQYIVSEFTESFEAGVNWGLYLSGIGLLTISADAILFCAYVSLHAPFLGLIIVRRYIEPHAALGRRLSFMAHRYGTLRWLEATCRGSLWDSRIINRASALNFVIFHLFLMVFMTAFLVISFRMAVHVKEEGGVALCFTCLMMMMMMILVGSLKSVEALSERIEEFRNTI